MLIKICNHIRNVLLIVLCITFAAVIVAKTAMFRMTREMRTYSREIARLREVEHILNVEWAYLTSPERVISIAEKMRRGRISEMDTPNYRQVKTLSRMSTYYSDKDQQNNQRNMVTLR